LETPDHRPKEWADSREGFYEKHIPCRRDGIERLPAAKKTGGKAAPRRKYLQLKRPDLYYN